jgi:hypothetical protein
MTSLQHLSTEELLQSMSAPVDDTPPASSAPPSASPHVRFEEDLSPREMDAAHLVLRAAQVLSDPREEQCTPQQLQAIANAIAALPPGPPVSQLHHDSLAAAQFCTDFVTRVAGGPRLTRNRPTPPAAQPSTPSAPPPGPPVSLLGATGKQNSAADPDGAKTSSKVPVWVWVVAALVVVGGVAAVVMVVRARRRRRAAGAATTGGAPAPPAGYAPAHPSMVYAPPGAMPAAAAPGAPPAHLVHAPTTASGSRWWAHSPGTH